MQNTIIACLALALMPDTLASDDHPNVLFIAVDDLNDWIGCLDGHPQAHTPNIDRLAARGMLFRNAHCAAPACNPSRAAVFSGRMPGVTGVWSNDSRSLGQMYPDEKTLPVAFRRSGYITAGTGKLLHKGGKDLFDRFQSQSQRWSPFPSGDVKYTEEELASKGTANPRHSLKDSLGREVILPLNRMPSDRKPNQNDGESFDWGGFDLPDTDWGDTKATNWGINQLQQNRRKPLFLAVGYYRPHIPLFAPLRFFDRFKTTPAQLPPYRADDLLDLNSVGKRWATEAVTAGSHATVVKHDQWRAAVEGYLACTTYVDFEIGRLIDALDQSRHRDNTLIVLWSDHGWQLGEKNHWGKWTGWERSTKVPLIIVPPGSMKSTFAPGGTVCDHPVSLIDLFPTLMEVCRLDGPSSLDGTSLLPLLRDPQSEFRPFTLTMFDKGNTSLRDSRYRYIRYAEGAEELYDLQADPNEWTNLANRPASENVISRFRQTLDRRIKQLGSTVQDE